MMILVFLLAIHFLQNLYLIHLSPNSKTLLPTKLSMNTPTFSKSVIAGLRDGFWPWAKPQDDYPLTHNEPQHPPRNDCECDLLLLQCRKEIKVDCFSEPFDTLLPGMNVVPVHVVPKPPDDKLRLVVDHHALMLGF